MLLEAIVQVAVDATVDVLDVSVPARVGWEVWLRIPYAKPQFCAPHPLLEDPVLLLASILSH